MNNNSNILQLPQSGNCVQTPQLDKDQEQHKNAKGNNNKQVFRIQQNKLVPSLKNNQDQIPSTQILQQRLEDKTQEIKLLQKHIAELKKENDLLKQRVRKEQSIASYHWEKVRSTMARLVEMKKEHQIVMGKKVMYKNRIKDTQKYIYDRYTKAQLYNAPFSQLEELRQTLLLLGICDSRMQEMQQLNQQNQNKLNINIGNMTQQQILHQQERIINQKAALIQQQIKNIPKKINKANDNVIECCTICQDYLQIGDVYKQLPCKHIYHSKCINMWLLNKQKCPVCNLEVIFYSDQH